VAYEQSQKPVSMLLTGGQRGDSPQFIPVPGARPHIPVDRDAPLAEFAASYPTFRVEAVATNHACPP
jgi:hypothetical protein